MSERVHCRGCDRWRDVEAEEWNALNKSRRLVKRDLTGEWRGGNFTRAEYDIDGCSACENAPKDASIPIDYQMARIRRHQRVMEARGVARDDAIREAVSREMIRSEVRLSPMFVAKLTGNERLLDAHESSDIAIAEAWSPPVASVERGCKVDGCQEGGPYRSCEMCALPTCARHLVRHFTPMAGFGLDVCPVCMELL